ncbi:MAG: DUF3299 domain-containing protein [Opitutaceae bacterium]|nr:DUF3299 domain-containing protein [Opitutaceae bacterium]
MTDRCRFLFAVSASAVALLSGAHAALFPPKGLLDHTLCCGSSFQAPASEHRVALPLAAAPGAPAAMPASSGGGAPKASLPLEEENGYVKLGFDRLAGYTFKVPPFDPAATPNVKPPTGEEQIPDWLKKLNGRKARVTGFMLPLKMEGGLVTEFLLLSDPMMCCYGAVPDMNQWVVVKMKNGGVRPIQDVPISFYGDIKVGAMFENGYMTGIYSLDGDKMGEIQG